MTSIKKSVVTALCAAFCVVLPMAFHAIPRGGMIFLPMHIPVLLCGLLCGWPYGLACGILGPMLSHFITAMPNAAALPGMLVECAVYGGISGLMMQLVHTGKLYADLYISLTAAMVAGRILGGAAKALLFAPGSMTLAVWASTYFAVGLPGILIQLVLLPSIVFLLMKSRLIPRRY